MRRFIAVTFGLGWAFQFAHPTSYFWLAAAMWAPALGALAEGFRPPPPALTAGRRISYWKSVWPIALWVALLVASTLPFQPVQPQAAPSHLMYLLTAPFMPAVVAFIGAFGEEYGWRGYLTPALARRLGWAKASVAVGVLWGVWHAPVLLLGHNYFYKFWPPSVLLMAAFCAAASPFFTYVYLRHGVWGAAASHGGVNAFAGLYYLLYPPEPVWLSNPAGLAGTLAWLPLSLYAYSKLRRAAKESSASADVSTPGT